MPRPLRTLVANGVCHVTARGVNRMPIYRDEEDRRCFERLLEEVVTTLNWACLAYCQMANHYHLLLRTPQPNLSDGMRILNGEYAQAFNARHGRTGHLFQGRFHSEPVLTDVHLLETARYIDRNPVRARICDAPADWAWSGHRSLIGPRQSGFLAVDELLERFAGAFGGRPSAARVLDFVGTGIDRPVRVVPRRGRPPRRT